MTAVLSLWRKYLRLGLDTSLVLGSVVRTMAELIRRQPRRFPKLHPLRNFTREMRFEFLWCRAERLLAIGKKTAAHLRAFRDGGNLAVDQVDYLGRHLERREHRIPVR